MQRYEKFFKYANLLNVLSLTELVFGIFLVDYVEATLATHDFAVGGALLDRCFNFHCFFVKLLELFLISFSLCGVGGFIYSGRLCDPW